MGAGGRRVILALPPLRGLSVRAILAVLPDYVREQAREERYRIYMTDALKVINDNFLRAFGGQAELRRYADIINPKPAETRTSGEIIEHMKQKLASLGGE